MTDTNDFMTVYNRRCEAQAKANTMNKAILFDALLAAGITTVTVGFDGEGDSGQIQDIIAHAGEITATLPDTLLKLHQTQWNNSDLDLVETAFPEAIETLCYGYLQQRYDGWENNDGGFGEFTFHAAERRITLDFNARFSDSVHSSHEF